MTPKGLFHFGICKTNKKIPNFLPNFMVVDDSSAQKVNCIVFVKKKMCYMTDFDRGALKSP